MTTETRTPKSKIFVTAMLPWLLSAGMFVFFLVTLHRWLTPFSLGTVVDISGWGRGTHPIGPVAYFVTLPFRLLPVNHVPLALNVFTAVCAALTLGQLARSVALLPHDRTFDQRQREQSEFSFLTIPAAWVPPLFAVLVCALQLTFWENAIDATGEMFDLLIFAFVVRCLIEYRILHKESWVLRCAFVCGLGMADNWAMFGFFPLVVAAVIWIRGLPIFKLGLLLRIFGCGLLGFLPFFLLFPLMNAFHPELHIGFWASVRALVIFDKTMLLSYPRDVVLVLALTSLLPVLVISMRWASYFGDNSPVGIFMATSMFHIIHGLFFLCCLWVALDSPISPRVMGYGLAFLPFYYLGALCIGYFTGYFLLIFSTRASRQRTVIHPLLTLVNILVTACICVLAIGMPLVLARKNLPPIQSTKTVCRAIEKYFAQIEQALPPEGAVVLADDLPGSYGLDYLEAALHRGGNKPPHLLVNATQLSHDPTYLAFLQKRNPGYQLAPAGTNTIEGEPDGRNIIRLLDRLYQSHRLYYLHPSFGYFFERFYAEPQGPIYQLKTYPTNVWDVPVLTSAQITSNETYWKQTFTDVLPPLIDILQQPEVPAHSGYWEWLMTKLHLKPARDRLTLRLTSLYSRDLDDWGVELERSGRVKEAGTVFDQAGLLNPFNISAGINKGFNNRLLAGKEIIVAPPKDLEQKLGHHRSWTEILTLDGPIDEPNCRDDLSVVMGVAGNFRQSVQHLDRIKEIAPDALNVRLQLAQFMIYLQMYTPALADLLPYTQGYSIAYTNAEEVLHRLPDDPSALFVKSVSLLQLQAYDRAIDPLSQLISLQSTNYKAHLDRAIAYYKLGNLNAAKTDYEVVQTALPQVYQASYGLAKIADQQKDKSAAIKNYESYLTNAPPNTVEAKQVAVRLKELKSGAPAP